MTMFAPPESTITNGARQNFFAALAAFAAAWKAKDWTEATKQRAIVERLRTKSATCAASVRKGSVRRASVQGRVGSDAPRGVPQKQRLLQPRVHGARHGRVDCHQRRPRHKPQAAPSERLHVGGRATAACRPCARRQRRSTSGCACAATCSSPRATRAGSTIQTPWSASRTRRSNGSGADRPGPRSRSPSTTTSTRSSVRLARASTRYAVAWWFAATRRRFISTTASRAPSASAGASTPMGSQWVRATAAPIASFRRNGGVGGLANNTVKATALEVDAEGNPTGRIKELLDAEAAPKCDLLCTNCHICRKPHGIARHEEVVRPAPPPRRQLRMDDANVKERARRAAKRKRAAGRGVSVCVCVIDMVGCCVLTSNEKIVPQSWTPARRALKRTRPGSMFCASPPNASRPILNPYF